MKGIAWSNPLWGGARETRVDHWKDLPTKSLRMKFDASDVVHGLSEYPSLTSRSFVNACDHTIALGHSSWRALRPSGIYRQGTQNRDNTIVANPKKGLHSA